MDKQVIITVGRESGSGGLEIARKLGEELGIVVYDKNIFEGLGEHFDIDATELEQYDEKPRKGISRKVRGYSTSPEEQLVDMQREFLKAKADEGQSFIILGRCGIKALLDYPCTLIRIFVEADTKFKVARIMEQAGFSTEIQALSFMKWSDTRRKTYHDQFCSVKWGDRNSYDIVIKSNKLGLDGSAKWLAEYVRMRLAAE